MRWIPVEDSHEPPDTVNAVEESTRLEDLRVHVPVRRRKTIIDGPFAESKELFGGQWPPGSSRR
jgi:hypothetical protein